MDKTWKWVVLKAEKESEEDLQMDAEKTKGVYTLLSIVSNVKQYRCYSQFLYPVLQWHIQFVILRGRI